MAPQLPAASRALPLLLVPSHYFQLLPVACRGARGFPLRSTIQICAPPSVRPGGVRSQFRLVPLILWVPFAPVRSPLLLMVPVASRDSR